MSLQNLWVLKSKGDRSNFGGNDGYPDDPESYYIYDSTVKHHEKLEKGDLVIVTDAKKIIGFSVVSDIVRKKTTKSSYRCPVCGIKEFYPRPTLTPRYKCRKKHEFDTPKKETIPVIEYTAHYKKSFLAPVKEISVEEIRPYFINYNRYYSIQPTDPIFFSKECPSIAKALKGKPNPSHPDYLIEDFDDPPYLPSGTDDREFKMRKVPGRKGQAAFKSKLIRAYGPTCMLSKSNVPAGLEASHIYPYRGANDHQPSNGLLLRKDLHALFDANLLGIHPTELQVHLHHSIADSVYKTFQDRILQTGKKYRPSLAALEYRWKIFKKGGNIYLP